MSFFIEERETPLGDVSTDVVKFESCVDSRNLHCHSNSRDSTSETARERKVWALRKRSPVMVFSRNLSFMMSIQALIDGHWRAIWAILLQYFCEGERFVWPAQLEKTQAWPANCCVEFMTQHHTEDKVEHSVRLCSSKREGWACHERHRYLW